MQNKKPGLYEEIKPISEPTKNQAVKFWQVHACRFSDRLPQVTEEKNILTFLKIRFCSVMNNAFSTL